MLRPGNIVFDSADAARLARFWQALTGYDERPLFGDYLGLSDPSGRGPNLTFQQVEHPGPPGRCHIDLYVADPAGEASRVEQLGGRALEQVREGDVHWVVCADPEGNNFCLVAAVGPARRP